MPRWSGSGRCVRPALPAAGSRCATCLKKERPPALPVTDRPARRRCPFCSRAACRGADASGRCRRRARRRAESDRRLPSVSAGLRSGVCRASLCLAPDALEFLVVGFLVHEPAGFFVAFGPVFLALDPGLELRALAHGAIAVIVTSRWAGRHDGPPPLMLLKLPWMRDEFHARPRWRGTRPPPPIAARPPRVRCGVCRQAAGTTSATGPWRLPRCDTGCLHVMRTRS